MNRLSASVLKDALNKLPNAAQHYKKFGSNYHHFVQVPTFLQRIKDKNFCVSEKIQPRQEIKFAFVSELSARNDVNNYFDWVLVSHEEITYE